MTHKRFRRGVAWGLVAIGAFAIALYDLSALLAIGVIASIVWTILLMISAEFGWPE